jgi:tryptophanyl-tRNA synthetase
MEKETILTGIRSNSKLHLGNYLGVIRPIVNLQKNFSDKYNINMFIPDLHSFTTEIDHTNLFKQTLENLKIYVASGLDIDNKDTYVYRQSYISAHSELTWILSCFTYFGELRRMTQFKEKSGSTESNSQKETSVSTGLFIYPILMTADILLYDASWVPVGEDQRQHLELARDIAVRMNNKFGDLFVVPKDWNKQLEFINRDKGTRIRSLKNPDRKMSKSIEDPSGTILLSDKPDVAASKVMSATTDSNGLIRLDWDKQPGISNLLSILAYLNDQDINETYSEWDGKIAYGELKKVVADKVFVFLTDLQIKLADIDESKLIEKLSQNESKVNEQANKKLLEVQKAVGLRI